MIDIDELVDLHHEYLRALSAMALPAWVELELTLPQLRMLYLLVNDGEQTASGLAKRLGVAPSTVTGLVDRLVERGMAGRSDDPQDRRTIQVRSTAAGEVLINGLIASRREQLTRVLAGLTEDDRAVVAGALRALLGGVQAQGGAWDEVRDGVTPSPWPSPRGRGDGMGGGQ
jgi:DNA-binding MarR family transcriptional regulator